MSSSAGAAHSTHKRQPRKKATVDDLYHARQKAELVDGALVVMEPTGFLPGVAAGEIFASLRAYARRRTKSGYAIPDNVAFLVRLPHRQSFSPDAAFYTGQPTGMRFLDGPPIFAAEVRSQADYGARAERRLARKRDDYFAAGTLVVWDVDLLGADHSYECRASSQRSASMAAIHPEPAAVTAWR